MSPLGLGRLGQLGLQPRRPGSGGAPAVGSISDLSVEIVGDTVELSFTPATNAIDYDYRWGLTNPPDGEPQDLDLVGDDEDLPPNETVYFQVRGVGAIGQVGAWSNTDSIDTPDTAEPVVTSLYPVNGASGVSRFISPTVTFDETVVLGEGLISLYDSDDELVEMFDVEVDVGSSAGQVEVSGSVLTVHPTVLESTKEHYILMDEGVVEDAQGNLFEGIVDPTTWTFTTLTPSIVVGDVMTQRPSTGAVNLVNTGGTVPGPLNPTPGQLLVLYAYGRHYGTSGTSAQILQGALPGWTVVSFIEDGPAEDCNAAIVAWKIADGTEDDATIEVFTFSGAAGTVTNGYRYWVFSYDVVGDPRVTLADTAQLTVGDPDSRTILTSVAQVPCLAFSFAAGSTQPDQTFATQTPTQNVIEGNSGSPAGFGRVKTKLFTAAPADIVTDFADLGTGNALVAGFIEIG